MSSKEVGKCLMTCVCVCDLRLSELDLSQDKIPLTPESPPRMSPRSPSPDPKDGSFRMGYPHQRFRKSSEDKKRKECGDKKGKK